MKKSLIYFLFSALFLFNVSVFAEDDLQTDMQNLKMPTDEEIMETIKKFNFDKTQQEYLFKETKRKLQDMYSNQDFSSVFEGDSTLIDDSEEVKAQTKHTKKYSSHDDLSKRKSK